MSLEEKWSLALKVLIGFWGIFVASIISGIAYCIVQIHDLSIALARVPTENPPVWFAHEVTDLKNEVKEIRADLNSVRTELARKSP